MTNRRLEFIVRNQRPLTLQAHATAAEACKAMHHHGAGSVLVLDEANRLVGIFTGRDALRLLARGHDPSAARLAEAMTGEPVSVTPKSRALDALRAMLEGGFRHVPVVDDGRLHGCVSRGDLKGMELHLLGEFRKGNPNRSIRDMIAKKPPLVLGPASAMGEACRSMHALNVGSVLVVGDGGRLLGIFTGRDAVKAAARGVSSSATLDAIMTPNPITIGPDATAIDALRTMNDGGFRHLPVVENGAVVGIVTRTDFHGLELDRLDQEEHLKETLW